MQLSSSFYRDQEEKKKGIDRITINTIILHNLVLKIWLFHGI